ncbi:hypothetical protein FXO38_06418 [Capsicum annuum]|nr:hypothetical protein FXO38_06418 [Capsicum annuum]
MEDLLAKILNEVEGMEKIVGELKEDFISLSRMVVSHLISIKELGNQMDLVVTLLDAKPNGKSTFVMINNLQNDDQILEINVKGRKIKEKHMTEDLGRKLPSAQSKERLSQSLINDEMKEVKSIIGQLIDKGEFDKWDPMDPL